VGLKILLHVGVLLFLAVSGVFAQLPDSALSVQTTNAKLLVWWQAAKAPVEWGAASAALSQGVRWHAVRPGLESAVATISGDGVGWRIQLILARLDPSQFSFRLKSSVQDLNPAWRIDSAPEEAALAVNAGQFETIYPWGWLVQNGKEVQPPGYGPLSSALAISSTGKALIVDAADIETIRARGDVQLAFQSYPAILVGNGIVPEALRGPDRGVDLKHRDSRLALGVLRDGRLLLALTRFGGTRLPFGPTTPEMAAIMGALGCVRAMLLDGGLSGQLIFRDVKGHIERWPGFRSVPLGLLAFPK